MLPERAEDAEDDLPAGVLIAGRFVIVRTLGRGGMATVYEAWHQVTRRPVALKIANQKLVNNKLLSGRFLREARTASTIRHAHAIEVSDVFETTEGRPVMVMELLEGRDLAAAIRAEGRLGPREVADIFVPVLSALAHAHAEGIVHRDMKPDNIFLANVNGTLVPKVLDFGIAKVVGEAVDSDLKLTSTGMLLGTPFYMSPEQVSGRDDLDHAADIWSVGVCMYEALTGELPFEGANFGQVFAAILQSDPPRMADVPRELEAVVRRCLSKKPEDRPKDSGELARALSTWGGAGTSKYPLPATSSGRFGAVRSDAPTLASEPPGASAASGEHAVPDRLTFSDTTVRVHPNPRRRWWIAAFVIACVLVGGVVYVWNLPEPTVYRPALPDPVVTVTDEASQNPDEAAVGGSGAIETSNEEAEVATSNQETDAALDPESAEGALPRPRMMRRARMVPGTVMETAEQTTAMTDMSGIINQL